MCEGENWNASALSPQHFSLRYPPDIAGLRDDNTIDLAVQHDLLFNLGAVRFIRSMQQHGLPVCRPEIVPMEDRLCLVSDSYNANLALHNIAQGGDFPDGVVTSMVEISAVHIKCKPGYHWEKAMPERLQPDMGSATSS